MQDELIDQLEELFISNKNNHRSPIINLPEILMFKYDEDDLFKCGENFRECQFAKDNDPVNNTVRYYTDRFQNTFSQPALNKILEIIINNKYSIFHIDPNVIYMVSVDPDSDTKTRFCVDRLTIHLANSNSSCNNKELTSDKLEQLWKSENPPYDFNELSQYIYGLVHSKGYHMNKDIMALAKYNDDYMDNLNIRPAFESGEFNYNFAMEANQQAPTHFDIAGQVDSYLNESKLATADSLVGDRLDVSRSARTAPPPEDDPNNQQQQDQQPQEGDPNQQQPQEGGQNPNQEQQPQEGDPNQQPQEGEEQDPNAQYDDQQQEEQPPEEPPPSPGEEILNDPEAKPKYRLKFVVLYKNIGDVIESLEAFTPEYNSAFVSKYYQIQTDLGKLKSAIYKICTDRINSMDVDDVMKAYASANITYDLLCKLLDEFMTEYTREREKLTGTRQKIKEKIKEKSFSSARK